jgi:hypothetical protein
MNSSANQYSPFGLRRQYHDKRHQARYLGVAEFCCRLVSDDGLEVPSPADGLGRNMPSTAGVTQGAKLANRAAASVCRVRL